MRQKFRKFAKGFDTEMTAYRENPEDFDSDQEVEDEKDADQGSDDEMGPDAFRKETSVVRQVIEIIC